MGQTSKGRSSKHDKDKEREKASTEQQERRSRLARYEEAQATRQESASLSDRGNRPVPGKPSYRKHPCRACKRPWYTKAPSRMIVGFGMDDDGNQIEFEYALQRTSEGTGRTRDPEETLACHIDECRILKSGDIYYDYSGRSDHVRRPTTQELYHVAANAGGAPFYGTIWSQKHVVQYAEPKELSAKDKAKKKHEAEPGEPTPQVPYCPPGHVLCPIVSKSNSVRSIRIHVPDTCTSSIFSRTTGVVYAWATCSCPARVPAN